MRRSSLPTRNLERAHRNRQIIKVACSFGRRKNIPRNNGTENGRERNDKKLRYSDVLLEQGPRSSLRINRSRIKAGYRQDPNHKKEDWRFVKEARNGSAIVSHFIGQYRKLYRKGK